MKKCFIIENQYSLEKMKKIGLGFLLIAITLILIFTINTSKRDHDDTNTQIYKSVESEERKLLGISFLLQKKMQELGQMSCFLSAKQVSLNGGWCSEISGRNSTQHQTDQALLKYLSKFLKGKFQFFKIVIIKLLITLLPIV